MLLKTKGIFAFILFLVTISSFGQALYKETTKINDSVDYYLEIALFNKEDKNSFNKAIIYTEKAILFAKANDLEPKLADCYLILGGIYYDLQKPEKAIEHFIRSINIYTKENPNPNLALSYYNLGKCYLEQDKQELSEIYFKKAASIYQEFEFYDAIELINVQKGIIQKNKGNFLEAEAIFKKAINNISNQDALADTKVEAFFQLGEIQFLNNNFSAAIEHYNDALKLNEQSIYNIALEKKILKKLSRAHNKNSDFKKSNEYLERYVKISDSISQFYSKYLSENTFEKVEFDKQLETIENLDKEKKNQQKTLRFSKLISILSIALISILSLLSLSLYKNNKIRITTNKLLKDKNRELTKEKEKVEKASKARAEFLATVSHELRTPLNAINGITYLLLQEKPKKSQLNYLNSLEFSGKYLLNFINDILEINRLESDKVVVEKISFNLNELIENIKVSFNEFIVTNNISYVQNIDKSIDYNIIGDPTKLSQILINLINNAIKFSKNGEVIFSVKQQKAEDNLVTLDFEIKDTGIGIPSEKQKDIFESFSQGSVEINRTYGGTGLGLSIVKKLLSVLKSDIELTSEEGKGTQFNFSLIFEKGNNLPKVETEVTNSDSVFVGKSILLVEDNKINQMITKKMVEKKGMTCEIIDNGEDAIEHLKSNSYDLVLMDVHLPGINGTEATTEIRKFNSEITIIALTAISLNENREMLLSFGMNDVVTKPFIPENFYDTMAKYLTKA
ncbi:response regulator [Flavobacterium okayamense]|uniref:histidine kinase n=1 Tax=Flavobacterium okayamense TaxID=2830782 RepID=A0ABM7S4Q1_9FLAO|nr:response regulator [Flavobacterium okayamense]BCY28460.1 histidine kinase [Flavobacterium okayamense]